ncbi:MAG: polymerase, sigma-24 subunit, subfamily [Conexibacter sp.]|nr:polymerase, sigma-24 subunit, subfamily [Conexibacter sp.]
MTIVRPRVSDALLRTQTDERLVALTRAGHERAFAAIVERYRRPLVGFARATVPAGRAEDVVQQALMSAWAALAAGAEVAHLRGWLHQIVRHEALRAGEREVRERHVPLEDSQPAAGHERSGRDAAIEAEQRLRARAALAGIADLPTRQRDALVQSALEGRSRTEIAATMGMSEGAVRQLVHRARATLRAAVTAVTPFPLADWAATAGGGGGPGVAELAAGAGGATIVGLMAKAGAVVVATGAIATGVATHAGDGPQATPARADEVVSAPPQRAGAATRSREPLLTGVAASPFAVDDHGGRAGSDVRGGSDDHAGSSGHGRSGGHGGGKGEDGGHGSAGRGSGGGSSGHGSSGRSGDSGSSGRSGSSSGSSGSSGRSGSSSGSSGSSGTSGSSGGGSGTSGSSGGGSGSGGKD